MVVADEEDGVAVTKILFPFVSLPLAAVKLMLPNTTIVEFGCVALCSSCIFVLQKKIENHRCVSTDFGQIVVACGSMRANSECL